MAQNIYDDPEFLAGYSALARQRLGLGGAPEWPTLRSMVPALEGRRVIDLGCGFGWFSQWADQNGAASVLGIDLSSRMLERARAENESETVIYRRVDLNQLDLEPESVDLVFSSLALHYVNDLDRLLSTTTEAMTPGAGLVFSVEHPIYSAPTSQVFETSSAGKRIWPLDNYLVEGQRRTTWFVDGVIKQHRTVASYVNAVIAAGLVLDEIVEFGRPTEAVTAGNESTDDQHRPWFLLVKAIKPDPSSTS